MFQTTNQELYKNCIELWRRVWWRRKGALIIPICSLRVEARPNLELGRDWKQLWTQYAQEVTFSQRITEVWRWIVGMLYGDSCSIRCHSMSMHVIVCHSSPCQDLWQIDKVSRNIKELGLERHRSHRSTNCGSVRAPGDRSVAKLHSLRNIRRLSSVITVIFALIHVRGQPHLTRKGAWHTMAQRSSQMMILKMDLDNIMTCKICKDRICKILLHLVLLLIPPDLSWHKLTATATATCSNGSIWLIAVQSSESRPTDLRKKSANTEWQPHHRTSHIIT